MELVNHPIYLIWREPCEGEHADLVRDVVPCARRALSLDSRAERKAHLPNAASHELELFKPLLLQLRLCQQLVDDGCSMAWRTRVSLADQDLDLRQDHIRTILGIAENMHVADALAIQAEVLGKGLRQEVLQTRLLEELLRI